jgi:hypothetical protein
MVLAGHRTETRPLARVADELTVRPSLSPAPLSRELKEFGRLGARMEGFHSHFRHEYVCRSALVKEGRRAQSFLTSGRSHLDRTLQIRRDLQACGRLL